jgi:hypothetical protein
MIQEEQYFANLTRHLKLLAIRRFTPISPSTFPAYQTIKQGKTRGFHGGDYEECKLLRYKTQFVPHKKHVMSRLQSPAVRFEVFTAVTEKCRLLGCYVMCIL